MINDQAPTISPNLGAGFYYTTNKDMYYDDNSFFIGAGFTQIIPLEEKFSNTFKFRKQVHANALIGARINQDFLVVEPSIAVNYAMNSPIHTTLSVLLEMPSTFWSGISYQTDNTVALQGGVFFKWGDGLLRIGALGNYNIGISGEQRGLGYEFLIAYELQL